MGPLPLLHSRALRLQRRSEWGAGEAAGEVPGRVQRHLFHWCANNPVPPATLFLEPASSLASGKIKILGSEVTTLREQSKMQSHLQKSENSRYKVKK